MYMSRSSSSLLSESECFVSRIASLDSVLERSGLFYLCSKIFKNSCLRSFKTLCA